MVSVIVKLIKKILQLKLKILHKIFGILYLHANDLLYYPGERTITFFKKKNFMMSNEL
jgi:hypothetical protein